MRIRGFPAACLLAVLLAGAAGAPAPITQGLNSYFKAREVLDAGVAAIGGQNALQAVKAIRREFSGDWIGSGQHPRPYAVTPPTLKVPPANGHTKTISFIDYAANRWLDDAVESDDTGDYITHVHAVTESGGFETILYRDEKPYYHPISAEEAQALHVHKFRRYPEGVLRMALSRPETLEWVGEAEELGGKQQVISFTDSLGARVLLYFDAQTRLLTKSETLREHPIAGDSSAEIIFLDYRQAGNLLLPFHYIDRTAGIPVEEMRASSIELDAALPQRRFTAPRAQDVIPMAEGPSEPAVQKLGENLYMIRGPYNIVFAAFRDHVVVIEAPLSSRYAETCLRLIRETVPDKPVRYLVSTHFHYDHVAGVRPYISAGIPIITTRDAKGVIEQVAASRRTMYPDALSRDPQAPRIETVTDRKVLDDGTNRVELYDFGPTEHITQMLVAYFPKEKLLFEADVWDPLSTELAIGGSDTVNMARKIRELGLRVERIIPVHGVPSTREALEKGLAVRAKYFP